MFLFFADLAGKQQWESVEEVVHQVVTHSEDEYSLTYEDLKCMLDWKERLEDLSIKVYDLAYVYPVINNRATQSPVIHLNIWHRWTNWRKRIKLLRRVVWYQKPFLLWQRYLPFPHPLLYQASTGNHLIAATR